MTEQTSHEHSVGSDLRSLRRSRDERLIAGVLGGLAQRLGVDPVLLRIVTVVLAIFGGVGIVVYALGWLLIPEDGEERSLAEKALSRGDDSPEPATLWLAGGLTLAVIITAGTTFSSGVGTVLLILAAGGVIVMLRRDGDAPASQFSASTADDDPTAAAEPSPDSVDQAADAAAMDQSSADDADTIAPDGAEPATLEPDNESAGDEPPGGARGAPSDDTEPSGDVEPSRADALSSPGLVTQPASAWPDPPDWPGSDIDQFGYELPEAPTEPEKRSGSHLGSLTLSAVAVALGILAVIDATSAAIPASAYVALALAIIGTGLLIGTWFGRSRGLIAWGLLGSLIALPATAFGDFLGWDLTGEDRTITISDVAAVPDGPRSHGMGRIVYDLRDLELADTGPIELDISQNVGSLQVMVPGEADVTVNASTGLGHIAAFEEQAGGHQDIQVIDLDMDGPGGGEITLNLDLGLGEILVDRSVDVPPVPESARTGGDR